MEVGTQFRFRNNDFDNPVVTTPAERTAMVRISQADHSPGYRPGTRIVFIQLAEKLDMLIINRPSFFAAA